MNHAPFLGQVIADHQADLRERARRHRLVREAAAPSAGAAGERTAPRPAGSLPRERRSFLTAFNLLLAATALTVAVVAIATDEAHSVPTPTGVTAVGGDAPAVAPDDARTVDDDMPAGDCTSRRLVVRC